jgi:hypothetical protein
MRRSTFAAYAFGLLSLLSLILVLLGHRGCLPYRPLAAYRPAMPAYSQISPLLRF